MYRIAARVTLCLLLISASSLGGPSALAAPAADGLVAGLRRAIQSPPPGCTVAALDTLHPLAPLLDGLYAPGGHQPLWRDPARYEALIRALDGLVADGLDPARYGAVALRGLRNPTAAEDIPCRELLASSAYLAAIHHLNHGVLDRARLEPLWVDPRADVSPLYPAPADALDVLAREGLADPEAALHRARPALLLYHRLREANGAWRARFNLATWPWVPEGPLLKPGMSDARVPPLRERLASVDLVMATPPSPDAEHYGDDLVAAVRAFQARHGLKVDGVVGGETLGALNTPRAFRQDQIRVNLERLRWLWRGMAPRMVLVDIAGARISHYRDGEPDWQARVQVGTRARPTPSLRSRITHLTFNPTWTVPPTIYRNDKLPEIRRDLGYLAKNRIRVLDRDGRELDPRAIDWHNPGAIRLRQDAGPTSALGLVAIRFPNPFAVYLHDTPNQQLFASHQRTFSSGCVRVEGAMGLADLLLAGAGDEVLGRVEAIKASGRTRNVDLPAPVPLVMDYWTVAVDDDGALVFRPDIYHRDPALIAALRGAEQSP